MRPLPPAIPASTSDVRARLMHHLLVIRSVWFPTLKELDAWQSTEAPLYVSAQGPNRVEVGPRLHNMWASCFSPVVHIELRSDAGGTALDYALGLPRTTRRLMIAWGALMLIWLAVLAFANGGEDFQRTLPFWLLLSGATAAGPVIGRTMGGRALSDAIPGLQRVLERPVPEAE